MNQFTRLSLWTVGASLAMFGAHAWFPEGINAVGVVLGFLITLQVLKIKDTKPLVQDGLLLGMLFLIIVLSYILLLIACVTLPGLNQCTPGAKAALVVADVGFVGPPILALLLFVRIPLLLRRLMER